MLHANLDCSSAAGHGAAVGQPAGQVHGATCGGRNAVRSGPGHAATVVEENDVMTRDDLTQTPIHGIAHLDKVFVEKDQEFPVEASGMGPSYEFHNHTSGDVAMLVHVDGAFGINNEELAVAQTEHTQRS